MNFDKIRKQFEQERAEKIQMQQRVAELEKQQAARLPYKDDSDDEPGDEPYVDHKNLTKKLKKFDSEMEQKIDKRAEERVRVLLEQEKQESYMAQNSDFKDILAQENIQKFAEKHPEIARRMLKMPDTFDRQVLLYEQIKALEVNKKEAPKESIQQKIDANRRGAFYQPTGIGTAPYAQAGDFSPSGQKSAYAKLQELKAKMRI